MTNITAQASGEEIPTFPLDVTENDNSADSQPVKETDTNQSQSSDEDKKQTENENDSVNSQDDEKNLENKEKNLADNPRWKEREDDWKKRYNDQEVRHTDEITKLREEVKGQIDGLNKDNSSTNVPEWFAGDEESYKQYLDDTQSLISLSKKEVREELIKEFNSKSISEQKAISEATQYFNNIVNDLEAETGQKIDKNKLSKITLDEQLVDIEGRWNYRAAFKIMNAVKSNRKDNIINEKKKIASDAVSRNDSDDKKSVYTTSEDFQGTGKKPW